MFQKEFVLHNWVNGSVVPHTFDSTFTTKLVNMGNTQWLLAFSVERKPPLLLDSVYLRNYRRLALKYLS